MTDVILHVTSRTSWSAAREAGVYIGDSLAGEGFIHCSNPDQVVRVANHLFPGQHGLVMLVVDPRRLKAELRWEPGVDLASELFPHVYGPLNLDALLAVLDFEPGPDGTFTLPELDAYV